MQRFLSSLIDALFPPHPDVLIAREVSEEGLRALLIIEYRAKLATYSGLLYSDPRVRALVRANKYHNDESAAKKLAALLGDILEVVMDERALDPRYHLPLLVPIPTSPSRARERGRHQIKALAALLPGPVRARFTYADILKRQNRKSQITVQKEARMKNIAGAFFVPPHHAHLIHERAVILIDDVAETGATMKDAMRALGEAGAAEVIGVALAK